MDNPYPKGTIAYDLMEVVVQSHENPVDSEDDTANAIGGLTLATYAVGAGLIHIFDFVGHQVGDLAKAVRESNSN